MHVNFFLVSTAYRGAQPNLLQVPALLVAQHAHVSVVREPFWNRTLDDGTFLESQT